MSKSTKKNTLSKIDKNSRDVVTAKRATAKDKPKPTVAKPTVKPVPLPTVSDTSTVQQIEKAVESAKASGMPIVVKNGTKEPKSEDAEKSTLRVSHPTKAQSVAEPPAGWVKLRDVHRKIVEEGRSLSVWVREFGGDRAVKPPAHDWWKIVYVGTTRYMPKEALAHVKDLPLKKVVTAATKSDKPVESAKAEPVKATESAPKSETKPKAAKAKAPAKK